MNLCRFKRSIRFKIISSIKSSKIPMSSDLITSEPARHFMMLWESSCAMVFLGRLVVTRRGGHVSQRILGWNQKKMASLSSKNAKNCEGSKGSRGNQKLTNTKKEVLSDLPGMLFQAWLPLHGEGKRLLDLLDLVDLVDLPSETLSIVHPINDQRRVGHTKQR